MRSKHIQKQKVELEMSPKITNSEHGASPDNELIKCKTPHCDVPMCYNVQILTCVCRFLQKEKLEIFFALEN